MVHYGQKSIMHRSGEYFGHMDKIVSMLQLPNLSADGVPRNLTGGYVLIKGQKAPICW